MAESPSQSILKKFKSSGKTTMKIKDQPLNFDIDIRWCLEQLRLDGHIHARDQDLISTTQRNREQLKWHPLQWIAQFNLQDQLSTRRLTLTILCQWLADKAQIQHYVIDPLKADVPALTQVMTQEFALKNHILAVELDAKELVIGTVQPFNREWIQHLYNSVAGRNIRQVLLNPEQMQRYIIEYYQLNRAVHSTHVAKAYAPLPNRHDVAVQLGEHQNPDVDDQHIVSLVDWLLQFAFEQRASDIHLEPAKEEGRVRFRIDGQLHTIYRMPSNSLNAVIARLKILSRMNVAEKRRPQDGRLKTRTPKSQETELRLATLPTAFGEKMVLRVFDPEVLLRSFEQLGFDGELLTKWQHMTQQRHGIILVTGPTGSGKTTTLYSTLKQLATEQVNVCTVEDPIEMVEDSFNQMQVNPAIELSFADGIRALMRQDPDIIMVGEIRDQDTANMAIQAALTGHLVLSTLHTNDAPSSLTRLHDLGVQPFLSAATLLGVLAQRLVRKLCQHCKQETALDQQQWAQLTAGYATPLPEHVFQAIGCSQCRHTGYQGRIGLYEFMPMSSALKYQVTTQLQLEPLRAIAKQEGVMPLRIAGAQHVAQGRTSLQEVMSVVPI